MHIPTDIFGSKFIINKHPLLKKNYYEQGIVLALGNATKTKNMTFKYLTAWK